MEAVPFSDEQFFAYRRQLGDTIQTIATLYGATFLATELAEEAIALVEETLPLICGIPGVDRFTSDPVVTEIRSAASMLAMNSEHSVFAAVSSAVETIVAVRRQKEASKD
jgi:hypothetical protein